MMVEKMIKQVNSMTWFIAILHLLRGDFLDQKQCCIEYYDTKAFCMSTDGSFGKILEYREGKFESRVSVYSGKHKTLLFP